jgi:hypothetical protein
MKTIIISIIAAVLGTFTTTSYAQDSVRIDSTQSLRQQIANLELKQDAFAKQQASVEYSLTMHHKEFIQGVTCTITGAVLSTSAIFIYQAARPKMTYTSFGGWSMHGDSGLKSLSYITGAAGAILGTVGFVMMIDSDKWFNMKYKTKPYNQRSDLAFIKNKLTYKKAK